MNNIRVIGHIDIAEIKRLVADHCDECGNEVPRTFGDARHEIERVYKDDTRVMLSICDYCYHEEFYSMSAKTIFD